MNVIQTLIPVLSKALGRDLSIEADLFYRARAAVGNSLNDQGKAYFIQNYPKIVDFMETPDGQAAIADFMNKWVQSTIPKSIAREPVTPPPAIPALEQLPPE